MTRTPRTCGSQCTRRSGSTAPSNWSVWRSAGNKQGVAQSPTNLAVVGDVQEDWVAAMPLYKDSLVLKRELGDKRGIATTLGNLGAMCLDQGDIATARVYAEESLTL